VEAQGEGQGQLGGSSVTRGPQHATPAAGRRFATKINRKERKERKEKGSGRLDRLRSAFRCLCFALRRFQLYTHTHTVLRPLLLRFITPSNEIKSAATAGRDPGG
jgi:hypothetical protein